MDDSFARSIVHRPSSIVHRLRIIMLPYVAEALPAAPDDIVELRPRQPLQHTLARWLAALKPDWFPNASALAASLEHEFAQAGGTIKIWAVVQNTRPRAWLWARYTQGSRQVEIVRLGAEADGRYTHASP